MKKDFVLKNYRVKRFFYKFFMRKSFRSALLFAVIGGVSAIIPLTLLAVVLWLSFGMSVAAILSFLGIVLLWGIYLLWVYIAAVAGLIRKVDRRHVVWGTCLVVILPVSWLVWLAVYGRKYKYTGVFTLAILAILLGVAAFVAGIVAGKSGYSFYIALTQTAVSAAALLLVREKQKLCYWFAVPLLLAILCYSGCLLAIKYLDQEKETVLKEISIIANYPVRLSEAVEYNQKGLFFEQTPLGALSKADKIERVDYDEYDPASLKQKLENIRKEYPEFVQALDVLDCEFAGNVRKRGMEENPAATLLGHLRIVRIVGRYLATEIKLDPHNTALVERNNRRLQNLRNIMLEDRNSFLIGRLVALAIEAIRIDALKFLIVNTVVDEARLHQLIGEPVDWVKYYCNSLVEETMTMQWFDEAIKSGELNRLNDGCVEISGVGNLTANPALKLYFLCDVLHYMRGMKLLIASAKDGTCLQFGKKFDEMFSDDRYILSAMMMPALDSAYKRFKYIDVERNMLVAANRIVHFYRANRRLPTADELCKLNIKVLDIYDEEVLYHTGSIKLGWGDYEGDGFVLFSHDRDRKNNVMIRSGGEFGTWKLMVPLKNIRKIKHDSSDGMDLSGE